MSDQPERGRPTKYREEFAEQAYKLCLLGATDIEMASFFGVCEKTVNTWKHEIPEFLQSITDGKIKADAHLAHKLYCRAEGAVWEEQQAIKVKTGQFTEEVEIVTVQRAAPPDTTALIHWLQNRQSGKWRSTQSIQNLDKEGKPTDPPPSRMVVRLIPEGHSSD